MPPTPSGGSTGAYSLRLLNGMRSSDGPVHMYVVIQNCTQTRAGTVLPYTSRQVIFSRLAHHPPTTCVLKRIIQSHHTPSPANSLANDRSVSIGEMIDEVVENRLADFCYVAKDVIRLSIGGHVVTFSFAEGTRFLGLLLSGWRQTPPSVQTYMAAASLEKPAASDVPSPQLETGKLESGAGRAVELSKWTHQYDSYLDLTLAIAKELNLIVGFKKHPDRDVITILTQATAIEMSNLDAFEYLSGVIVEELRRQVST